MTGQQLSASQRMVERLHCAHAALGVRAEELDERAERAAAHARRLSLRAAEAAGARRRGGTGDGSDQLEHARRVLLGGRGAASRAPDEPRPPQRPSAVGERSVREYVRALDSAIALRPSRRPRAPRSSADPSADAAGGDGEAEWSDGELEFEMGGDVDDDDDDGFGMPVPYFAPS